MSLLDLILSQKIVVISLGAALLLMAVAALLTIIPRVRAYTAKRAQQRAVRQAERAAEKQAHRARQAVEAADDEDESEEVAAKRARRRVKAAEPQAATEQQPQVTQLSAKAVPAGQVVPAAATPATMITAPIPAPLTPADALPINEMQNILADVFVDDELLARYQVLLRGVPDISISELLTLCQKVAGQLGAGLEPATKEQ